MRTKIKRVETRFIQKQIDLTKTQIDVYQSRRGSYGEDKELEIYMEGQIVGLLSEVETLNHLLENCAE